MIVVSDTSPIANLIQVDQLTILELLFKQIVIPPAVHQEICKLQDFKVDLSKYLEANWIKVVAPQNTSKVQELKTKVDAGESEAIVVAIELSAEYLLIDERLGTKQALEEGLTTIGLIGVLLKAKELQIIPLIKPILELLETVAGFWISEKLKSRILKGAGE